MKHKFINSSISYVEIGQNKTTNLIIYGVYMAFDDGSAEKFADFQSNLNFLTSQMSCHTRIPVVMMGDFNSDLERNNRFDQSLRNFNNCMLECIEYSFPQNVLHTYSNGTYLSHIDHVFINASGKCIVNKCSIVSSQMNSSDHNAILTTINMTVGRLMLNNKQSNKVYKFKWNHEEFVEEYNLCVDD